jgi:HD-GYP domain-containing protein (c-di-GMP phosphodiesterase class II)
VVGGLTVSHREDRRDRIERRSLTLELLARRGSVEITRQRIAAGKLFYLDAESDWQGFEFIYVLSGTLVLKDGQREHPLAAGDYVHHHGLSERAYFRIEEEAELLMVASPPSFHLMREEMQGIMALARSVEEKDAATEGHCHRLERLSLHTGEKLGMEGEELVALSDAAYLHDVGKLRVPEAILNKPGLLDDEEQLEIQRHPEYGAQIIRGKPSLEAASRLVVSHHEWFDGTGYPTGVSGEDIPLGARVIAVVDAFDAMTSDRPYRASLGVEEARRRLREASGTQFDPRVVEAFFAVLDEE